MLNKKILMSGAQFFGNDAHINPYYNVESIDVEKAAREHDTIRRAFEQAGITIVQVEPPQDSQDGVYTANWALIRDGKAVLSRLPNARQAEEPYARRVLENLGFETITVPEDWHFSGQGDSLPCGKYLLAGSGYRSDPRAQAFAAETLGLELVQLQAIPKLDENGQPAINAASGWADSFFYDIDLAIAVLREDLIAYCPEAFDASSRAKIEALPLEKIQVSYDEAINGLACNLVSTGETVIMSDRAPKFRAAIEKRGLRVIAPDVSELAKGGGYIRCVSLTLD
ncbi:MAG: amidinotransferase [Candidatus Nomurabacteria bacterium]|jgi:N-dimethylarginine dimethylaminohydrolase|nr:amidinotransferase [Candidatus Nomurabacteria bacterium]